jgi:hypothetical protein
MSNLMRITPAHRKFQLQLIFGFLFLVSLLFAGTEAQFALCGATAQAVVVGVEDVYDSRGVQYPGHRMGSGPMVRNAVYHAIALEPRRRRASRYGVPTTSSAGEAARASGSGRRR